MRFVWRTRTLWSYLCIEHAEGCGFTPTHSHYELWRSLGVLFFLNVKLNWKYGTRKFFFPPRKIFPTFWFNKLDTVTIIRVIVFVTVFLLRGASLENLFHNVRHGKCLWQGKYFFFLQKKKQINFFNIFQSSAKLLNKILWKLFTYSVIYL